MRPSIEYTLDEASSLIETLSNNWEQVRDHLNQVTMLQVYRFQMREVSLPIVISDITNFHLLIITFLLAKYPRRVLSS